MKVRVVGSWIAFLLLLGFASLLFSKALADESQSKQTSDSSDRPWTVMASGGGVRTVGGLTIGVTIGQGCAGTVNLSSHTAHIGFWQNFSSSCCIGRRGNIDGSADNVIDILDLTVLVAYMFKDSGLLPCPEAADVNGLPAPLDILDLVYLVDFMFRAGPEPVPCP
jgi:hypothetical protein